MKAIAVINEFVTPYIEETLRLSQEELATKTKSEEGYTFLHALASFTRDRKVLRDQLVAVLLAGRDTTAGTLSWTFYELSRAPEIMRKLRDEIIHQVGLNRAPTYDDLKSMKYLQVCNLTLNKTPTYTLCSDSQLTGTNSTLCTRLSAFTLVCPLTYALL
jgi:cytochrome P450